MYKSIIGDGYLCFGLSFSLLRKDCVVFQSAFDQMKAVKARESYYKDLNVVTEVEHKVMKDDEYYLHIIDAICKSRFCSSSNSGDWNSLEIHSAGIPSPKATEKPPNYSLSCVSGKREVSIASSLPNAVGFLPHSPILLNL